MNQSSIKGAFAKYVSLNIVGMLGLSCYILADTFFVARGIGADGLTALNLAIPAYSLICGAGLMLGMGGATRFSISASREVFTQALYGAAGLSCLLLALGLFCADPLAALLGADGDTLHNTSIYLKTLLCFSPMFLLNNLLLCFIRNDGGPRLAMLAMVLGSASNILLDYVFIFPCGMGMFGAALATGIAPIVSLLVLSAHFLRRRNTFAPLRCPPQPRALADLSLLGVSALITELSSGIVIIAFNSLLLGLEGNTGVAAYGVVANIALVVVAVFTGLSQGMQPLLSRCHGLGHSEDIKTLLRCGVATVLALSALIYAVSFVFAHPIVAAFNRDGDPRLAAIAVEGLRIYFVCFAFAGINILCAAYFSAVDRPREAFVLSSLRGIVFIIPAAVALSALLGARGVWLAMPATELSVLLVAVALLARVRRATSPF